MVGEIRDRETAQIAIEAALTGHLVLSTLHTNDAAGSITRLIEMGIEPFLVASAIDCVVAQRLVRVLCPQCKRRVLLPMATLREYGYAASFDVEGYEPVGCKHCGGSGYRGRTGIYEVMTVSAEIRALALERRSADEILEMAVVQGMHTPQGRRPRQGQAGANLDRRDRARRQRDRWSEYRADQLQAAAVAADMSLRASPWRSSTPKSCLRSWRATRPTST